MDYSLDEQQDVTKGGAIKPPRGSNGKVSGIKGFSTTLNSSRDTFPKGNFPNFQENDWESKNTASKKVKIDYTLIIAYYHCASLECNL